MNRSGVNVVKRLAQAAIPTELHPLAAAVYWWGRRFYCPICEWHARSFRPMADIDRDFKEWCVRCSSLARHRLLWLYLRQKTDLFSARLKVLHFAAEPSIAPRLRALKNLDYTTCDVTGGYTPGMEAIDATDIRKSNDTYDVVLCFHVLDHIVDDRRAMSEILRVLKPGGWAIVNSRMNRGQKSTQFVPRPANAGRVHSYHIYGEDFCERLESVGFKVVVEPFADELGTECVKKCFLIPGARIYRVFKPAQ